MCSRGLRGHGWKLRRVSDALDTCMYGKEGKHVYKRYPA